MSLSIWKVCLGLSSNMPRVARRLESGGLPASPCVFEARVGSDHSCVDRLGRSFRALCRYDAHPQESKLREQVPGTPLGGGAAPDRGQDTRFGRAELRYPVMFMSRAIRECTRLVRHF